MGLARLIRALNTTRRALSPCLGEPRFLFREPDGTLLAPIECRVSGVLERLRWSGASRPETSIAGDKPVLSQLEFSYVVGGSLVLEGTLEAKLSQGAVYLFAVDDSGNRYDAKVELVPSRGCADGRAIFRWVLEVPLCSLAFRISFGLGGEYPLRFRAGRFSRLRFTPGAYVQECGTILEMPTSGTIHASVATQESVLRCERAYQAALRRQGVAAPWVFEMRSAEVCRRLDSEQHGQTAPLRLLLCDRPDRAGDNAEALFAFLGNERIEGIDSAFVVSASTEDYGRLERLGRVVPFASHEHLREHLEADFVASSHAAQSIINPFGRFESAFVDLARARFVFLQHGVTKDDVSDWLARSKTNISLFVTASERERESIVGNPAYGLRPDQVVATGFPRHDLLLAEKDSGRGKVVFVAPTWRADLCLPALPRSRRHLPNPCFSQSSFFRFWNAVLNDCRIGDFCSEHGWKVRFVLHPAFAQESRKFSSPFAEIVSGVDYWQELLDASVFVTDYSSLAFDAALIGLPVVYAQENRERFYEGHSFMVPGYFSYDCDGFGPVCITYDETVRRLLGYMAAPVREDEYEELVRAFFVWPEGGAHSFPRCRNVLEAMRCSVR